MTSTIGNKGFSLIELLIVLLIIAIIVTVATIGINQAKSSKTQILFNAIKQQFTLAINISQLKNNDLRIILVKDENNDEYKNKIQKLNPINGVWEDLNNYSVVSWKDIKVLMDFNITLISPNSFITPNVIKVKSNNESYQFNTSDL